MKKIITLLLILQSSFFILQSAKAQAPQGIPYQAVLRDTSGNLIANQSILVRVNISVSFVNASNVIVYRETHTITTNELGLFTAIIGRGTVDTGNFSTIDWSNDSIFLKVEMDANNSGTYVDMGTTRMMSVPYALYAQTAGTSNAIEYVSDWNAITNTPPLASGVGKKSWCFRVAVSDNVTLQNNTTLDGINDWGVGDWAVFNGTAWMKVDNSEAPVVASDVAFTATSTISSTNVQNAVEELQSDFGDLLDSYIHQTEDGVYIYEPTPGVKRFGIGITTPEAPLGIKADADETLISLTSSSGSQKLKLRIKNTPASSPSGFSIDDASSSTPISRLFIQDNTGNIGIGTTNPTAKLEISDSVPNGFAGLKILNMATLSNQGWNIGQVNDNTGSGRNGALTIKFSDGIPTTGLTGLEKFTILPGGNVGINVTLPDVTLHVNRSNSTPHLRSNSNPLSNVSLSSGSGIVVIGSTVNNGTDSLNIAMDSHSLQVRMAPLPGGVEGSSWSSFNLQPLGGDILIHGDAATSASKVIIKDNGNMGIGETLPDAKLHVSRDIASPQTAIDLIEGTGIMVLGPITDNIVADYRGIQARTGSYSTTGLALSASELNLQRLGGNILFHGDNSIAVPFKAIITEDARLGLGTITPLEKIDIAGAIKIGTTTNTNNGTIRFTGTDFEGRTSNAWVSLTGIAWTNAGTNRITYNPTDAKVGIGVATPTEALVVNGNFRLNNNGIPSISASPVARITNQTTAAGAIADNRIGLEVANTGAWSSNGLSKDIGLYISAVTGQGNHESNMAAVLNGNVVVGALSSNDMIGTNGSNVLAIQTGSAPASVPGSTTGTNGGIQVYSGDLTGVSVLHIMNGNGEVIKFYRESALTIPVSTTVDGTYDSGEAAVINNLRERLNELEARLQNIGILY